MQGVAITLTIDLPDEDVTALTAKARERGVSAEHYARLVLEHDLKSGSVPRPVSQTIREIWADMPADVRAKLPRDGASQVDVSARCFVIPEKATAEIFHAGWPAGGTSSTV